MYLLGLILSCLSGGTSSLYHRLVGLGPPLSPFSIPVPPHGRSFFAPTMMTLLHALRSCLECSPPSPAPCSGQVNILVGSLSKASSSRTRLGSPAPYLIGPLIVWSYDCLCPYPLPPLHWQPCGARGLACSQAPKAQQRLTPSKLLLVNADNAAGPPAPCPALFQCFTLVNSALATSLFRARAFTARPRASLVLSESVKTND